MAVEEIMAKHIGMKDDKFWIDVWKDELESDTELLGHLNYVIKFFGGKEQKIPEQASGTPSCIPC